MAGTAKFAASASELAMAAPAMAPPPRPASPPRSSTPPSCGVETTLRRLGRAEAKRNAKRPPMRPNAPDSSRPPSPSPWWPLSVSFGFGSAVATIVMRLRGTAEETAVGAAAPRPPSFDVFFIGGPPRPRLDITARAAACRPAQTPERCPDTVFVCLVGFGGAGGGGRGG